MSSGADYCSNPWWMNGIWTFRRSRPPLVYFCHAEMESAKQKAIAEAQTARGRRRRLVDAARSVIAALEANGRPVDRKLRAILESALGANDVTLDAMQKSLDAAFRSMAVSAATDEPSEGAKGSLVVWQQEKIRSRLNSGLLGTQLRLVIGTKGWIRLWRSLKSCRMPHRLKGIRSAPRP